MISEDWRLATVIPIPKPGKDHAEPTNYRPIALTSCLCKTLERMINKRLIWYLESNNLLSRYQSGFRAGRSTNDNLVKLETFIRDAFVKKEHVVAVFFDLEKAYDTTWRYGIMKDIHKLGLRGRLPTFIALESPYHLVAVSGAHFTQGTILIVIIVSSGSAKSRTHQSAVGGFLVTRRGWPGRLRACRIWTFINSV